MSEPKRPMAGEWWFHNDSEPGDSATNRALLVECVLVDGTIVVESSEGSPLSGMNLTDFKNMHHEPRCDGWDWVVPEEESEEPLDEGKMVDIQVSLFHQIEELRMKEESLQKQCASLMSALKDVRTEMRKVFGVTTRRFAAICGVSCEQLSKWTGDVPEGKPDFACNPDEQTCSAPASPDDWVTQDRVPARPGIDERRYRYSDGSCGAWNNSAAMNWSKPARHGDSGSSAVVELRCRRKDYPNVAETGEAVVPMFGMKIVDADRVATEVRNEWSMGQKPAEAMNWVGDALGAVEKKQDEVAEVVEIPVWLVTRPSGKRFLVVDDVIETLPDDKVQKCRPMRLEVLK